MTKDVFEEFRMEHLVRTAQVWKRLLELGADENSELNFDFSFTAKRSQDAETLSNLLCDYSIKTSTEGVFRKTYTMSGDSGRITWTEGQLLKWVDYLIAAGRETNCEFEGCGAAATLS